MLSGDPMLAEASDAASAVPPLPSSPLLAAADPRFCSQSDQLGNRRPGIGACDIGAVELPPVISALASCQVTSTHGLNLRERAQRHTDRQPSSQHGYESQGADARLVSSEARRAKRLDQRRLCAESRRLPVGGGYALSTNAVPGGDC